MTKRTLYALLAVGLFRALSPGLSWAQTPAAGVPCGSCIGITILAGQKLLLPDDLAGLTILVRVPADAPDVDAREALSEIERRGGRPAVIVAPAPGPGPENPEYRLRVFLTQLRGQLPPGVLVALEATRADIQAALPQLSPYVDVIVSPVRPPGPGGRLWPFVAAADADAALRATEAGGFEQWVVAAPPDVVAARALIHSLAGAARRYREGIFEDVEVRGARRLTVEEIVARHQAAARRQAARVARTIARGDLTMTFEAPGFPAPITITAETTIFTDRERTELAQRNVRVNGVQFNAGSVPRLPILEPERVASPPLTITLTDLYRYRLVGEEVVEGQKAYVVAFEPVDSSRPLFRGRAWIAMDSFAMLRASAAQTALRGAIVSSEQVDEFRQASSGDWFLARSDVRQLYEGASHRTPIHRVLTIETHDIDPPDFDARRHAAYASDALLLRDTPSGYRYLRRVPSIGTNPGAPPAVEVAAPATRVRTFAGGVIIDPNISRPLPFAGLSYVDFDLFGTGAQLNAFFGGAYGQLAFSAPSLRGTRWQLGGRAFAIASSYNDRSFSGGREVYEENLRQRPAHVSTWLLRPLDARTSVRVGYALDYTRLRDAPETASSFVVPADQVIHTLQVALDTQHAGWAGSIWWHASRRAGWRAWGRQGEYDAAAVDFARYGVTVSRSTVLSPSLVTRVEAQWMDGYDLDRFSQYAFGTFDNRLRGYPSALVRYDRGGVVRGALGWSVSRVARLDAFVDTAAVRDRGYGSGLRNYTGVGLAAEAPVPFGMLAAVEWGYGFRGVDADGGRGTHVIRVTAFKVF